MWAPARQDSIHIRSIGYSRGQDQPVSAGCGDCALFARMLQLAEGRTVESCQLNFTCVFRFKAPIEDIEACSGSAHVYTWSVGHLTDVLELGKAMVFLVYETKTSSQTRYHR